MAICASPSSASLFLIPSNVDCDQALAQYFADASPITINKQAVYDVVRINMGDQVNGFGQGLAGKVKGFAWGSEQAMVGWCKANKPWSFT
jgi:hypothetical protein